jgi:hypothetical protein
MRSRVTRASLLAAFLCILGGRADPAPAPKLTWKYEGYSQLPAAAAEAKRTQRRLLVGLAGSGG